MIKKVVAFVDGENLVLRYQDMLKVGHTPKETVVHEPDSFVWSPDVTLWTDMDLVRVIYYTSVVGDSDRVAAVERRQAAERREERLELAALVVGRFP